MRSDLIGQAIPQAVRRLALQQGWEAGLWDRFSVGLRDVPDVRWFESDQLGSNGLAEAWLLTATEAPPRGRVRRVRRREPGRDRGEDCVSRLSLHHLPVEAEPLLEAGDVRRHRLGHAPFLKCGVVLDIEQKRVVERPRSELRRELQRPLPVLASHERTDRLGQLLVQCFKLRLARREVPSLDSHRGSPPDIASLSGRWISRPEALAEVSNSSSSAGWSWC